MRVLTISALGLPALLLAACSAGHEPEPAENAVDLHAIMKDGINPDALALWDISNAAIDDRGGIDASAMTDESWAALAQKARQLAADASELADAEAIMVAPPGVMIEEEDEPGASSAAEVQGFIDADLEGFKGMAQALALHTGDLAEAAEAQDAERAGLLVSQLDAVCESCHLKYWYPQDELPPGYPHPDEILGRD